MDVEANDGTATVGQRRGFGFDRLAQLLGGWQATELRAARGFPECRGLSHAQLEDLYQDTALALLSRSYASEEHLRNALRHGIRHRALNMHRDHRRRREILAEHAPAMHREAEASQIRPEHAALAAQDRLIAKEFLAELNPFEQQVFVLTAEGLRYRAIATALRVPVNEARSAARSCERKRARFQLLYETGRLCGYRAATVATLETQAGSLAAFELAKAHLSACSACRAANGGSAGEAVWRVLGAGAFVGMLSVGWGSLRRAIGAGGLTAKVTGAVVAAAVVTGSTLGVSGRVPSSHPPLLRPSAPPTRASAGPRQTVRDGVRGPGVSARRRVVLRIQRSGRVPLRFSRDSLDASGVAARATARVSAGQREFGLERCDCGGTFP